MKLSLAHLRLVLILGVSLLSATACGRKKVPTEESVLPSPASPEQSAAQREADGGWEPRVLGRAPAFELTDQDGATFSSQQLAGKIWVANFMFTRCPTICPKQTALLKSFQEKLLSKGLRTPVNIVSFSVDPANDTATVLKAYAEAAGADGQTWRFLTGGVEQMRQAIARDGFKLAVETDPDAPGGLLHSQMLVLIDASNRIRGLYDTEEPAAMDDLFADLALLDREAVHVPADIANPE